MVSRRARSSTDVALRRTRGPTEGLAFRPTEHRAVGIPRRPTRCSFRLKAVVAVPAHRASARDELGASVTRSRGLSLRRALRKRACAESLRSDVVQPARMRSVSRDVSLQPRATLSARIAERSSHGNEVSGRGGSAASASAWVLLG